MMKSNAQKASSLSNKSIFFLIILGFAAGFKWIWDFSTTRDSNEYTYHLHQIGKACVEQAGEYVFRKVENVEGVAQLRLRKYVGVITNETFLKHREAPYDLYGYDDYVASHLPYHFAIPYQYFETPIQLPSELPSWSELHKYLKPVELDQADHVLRYSDFRPIESRVGDLKISGYPEYISHYGFTFSEADSKVHGYEDLLRSELIVLDLSTQEVLGVRKAFRTVFFNRDLFFCPLKQRSEDDSFFVKKVIPPANAKGAAR